MSSVFVRCNMIADAAFSNQFGLWQIRFFLFPSENDLDFKYEYKEGYCTAKVSNGYNLINATELHNNYYYYNYYNSNKICFCFVLIQ